jgi:hypothetical protein
MKVRWQVSTLPREPPEGSAFRKLPEPEGNQAPRGDRGAVRGDVSGQETRASGDRQVARSTRQRFRLLSGPRPQARSGGRKRTLRNTGRKRSGYSKAVSRVPVVRVIPVANGRAQGKRPVGPGAAAGDTATAVIRGPRRPVFRSVLVAVVEAAAKRGGFRPTFWFVPTRPNEPPESATYANSDRAVERSRSPLVRPGVLPGGNRSTCARWVDNALDQHSPDGSI